MNPFLTSQFWEGQDTHVALAPGECAEGLKMFLEQELGHRACCLFQTSGSEGARKWVALTKEALLVSASSVNRHYEITEADHWLLALPIHHVGGFGVLARAYAGHNQVTCLPGRWNAEAFVRLCSAAGATLASLVPTQVFDLVSAKLPAPASVRALLVGGGALSAEVETAALSLGWPVRRTYGMTETASQIASQRFASGELEVLPIWTLSIGNDGVLSVRGKALAMGYAVFDRGEWQWESIPQGTGLVTRDYVTLHQTAGSQHLRFVGRESGIVKILGELVALRPLQERLEDLRLRLGIAQGDAVVCDLPDTRSEARLVLAVSRINLAQARTLQDALNKVLRPFERINEVCNLASIPRSDLGKVQMPALRQQIARLISPSHPKASPPPCRGE